MAKITRVTQKIFGSSAGAEEIAQFGSFAAGSPVLMGPGSPAAIQALPQYLQGWFASVINGAAPAIEDMNALQYLYAYQIAYGLQEGIPEYDGSTAYFINSIAKSGSILYISLTDNNTGNPVTDAVNWQQFFTGNIFPDGTVLSGVYTGDVTVDGAASLGSDVIVLGRLTTAGALTCAEGFSLTTAASVHIGGAFNFTPGSASVVQGNVAIGGDFSIGDNSEFKANPGQFPVLYVRGGVYSGPPDAEEYYTFDVGGLPEANGVTVFIQGQVAAIELIGDGGASAGTDNAGQGANVYINGHCDIDTWHFKGGASTFNGFSGGRGGSFVTGTSYIEGSVNLSGGNSTFDTGGDGGDWQCKGFTAGQGNSAPFISNGGNGVVAGAAGSMFLQNGGNFSGTVTMLDGTGTAPSGSGLLVLAGNCTFKTINLTNRTDNKIRTNTTASVILKVSTLSGKNVLTNGTGIDTGDVSAFTASCIFIFDAGSDTWYQIAGVPA